MVNENTSNYKNEDGGQSSQPKSTDSTPEKFYDASSVVDSPSAQFQQEAQNASPVEGNPPDPNLVLPLPSLEILQPDPASTSESITEAGKPSSDTQEPPQSEARTPAGGPSARNRQRCPPCTRRKYGVGCIGYAPCSKCRKRGFSAEQCQGLVEIPKGKVVRPNKGGGGSGKEERGMGGGELMGTSQEAV
jgi:hypothetical protein